MPGKPDIIATFLTLAGDVNPFDPDPYCRHPFIERAQAAAEAGYRGLGFGSPDLNHLLQDISFSEISTILDDLGLVHRELEVLVDWFADDERRQLSDQQRLFLLSAAEKLNARHIKVGGDLTGSTWSMDLMIEEFALLCDQAAEAGTAITIELFPTSNLADLQTGRAVVEGAGRRNGGLLLDIWHMVRGNIQMGAIASLPPHLINHVELDDGPLFPTKAFLPETLDNRLLPGEGEFPLAEFLGALRRCGYGGLYGVEILSDRFRQMPVREAARESFNATSRLFRN